ncbi:MAG: PorV/PorQ family protein [Ignavibacteria bacterium]|nr:PorV/PorQ family protein [Ignavibacteria bacterium]
MLRKKIILIIIAGLISIPDFAKSATPYQFLRDNSSARAAGLAGCFVSITDDASALFYNPASIMTVTEKRFQATFYKHVLDINSGQVSYLMTSEKLGMFAGSVDYHSNGSFDRADKYGVRNGTFGANDLSIATSYANLLDTNLYWGATAKFIYSNIEKYSSSAIALDAGLLYVIPEKRVTIGLAVLHAGFQLTTYDGTSEDLPLDILLGVSHRLRGLPMLVNFSFHHLADNQDGFFERFKNFSLGGEIYLGKYIQLRLGYDNMIRRLTTPDTEKKLSGLCGGAGIKMKDFNFDYSASAVGSGAYLHRFSIALDI